MQLIVLFAFALVACASAGLIKNEEVARDKRGVYVSHTPVAAAVVSHAPYVAHAPVVAHAPLVAHAASSYSSIHISHPVPHAVVAHAPYVAHAPVIAHAPLYAPHYTHTYLH